jgi:inner membrane protein
MRAKSHIAFGLSMLAAAISYRQLPFEVVALAGAVLGSLAPDIDCPASSAGRMLPFMSKPLYALCGHRTITHGIFVLGALAMFVGWVDRDHPGWDVFARSFFVGYMSHIVGDVLCDSGVQAVWPVTRQRISLWPHVKTGSILELFATHVLAGAIIVAAYFRCPGAFDLHRLLDLSPGAFELG